MEDVNLCVIAESSVTGFGARGGLQMCHPGQGICCLLCFESSISAFASLPEEEDEDEFGNVASAPARGCPSVWPCIPKSPPHFPRSPCSLCSVCSQPSPLPDFHPVFYPLRSPPISAGSLWVNPYFLNIWLPLMHLPSEQYEPSPFLFPVFPKLRYTGSSPGPITFPPLPFPQVCRAGIEPSPCPRKCGTVRTALPSFNPRLGILAPCLWDCLVGVTASLGSRIRAKVRTGTEIKPSSGSCRAYRAVGWGLGTLVSACGTGLG